jgi:hypothetical protein
MGTWVEARRARERRLAREQRYYTPDLRGPRCPVCHGWTDPLVVQVTGYATHPCCEPEYVYLTAQAERQAVASPRS